MRKMTLTTYFPYHHNHYCKWYSHRGRGQPLAYKHFQRRFLLLLKVVLRFTVLESPHPMEKIEKAMSIT